MKLLVVGCGYLGLRVARRALSAGLSVCGTTRSNERAELLRTLGIQPLVLEVTDPRSLTQLPPVDAVLYAVGRDRSSGVPAERVHGEGLRNMIAALPATFSKLVYISSTGVYGQQHGEWVDEDSPTEPASEGGRASLEAERLLASSSVGGRAVVLRMAGMYGPGRVPRPRADRAGRFLNLIHIEDAVEVVMAALRHAPAPSRFIVSDGHPVELDEYVELLARYLPRPATSSDSLSPPPSNRPGRGASNKRASNRRMLQQLQLTLRYPSCREGLAELGRLG